MTPERCPSSLDEMPQLEVRVKPDWKGVLGCLVGASLWLGAALRIRAARRALDDYHQQIGGVHYAPRGATLPLSREIEMHERVHGWQGKRHTAHALRYTFSRRYRRHAEAQAYALEVVLELDTLAATSGHMADPIYALGLTPDESAGWILAYVARWRRDCEDV